MLEVSLGKTFSKVCIQISIYFFTDHILWCSIRLRLVKFDDFKKFIVSLFFNLYTVNIFFYDDFHKQTEGVCVKAKRARCKGKAVVAG